MRKQPAQTLGSKTGADGAEAESEGLVNASGHEKNMYPWPERVSRCSVPFERITIFNFLGPTNSSR